MFILIHDTVKVINESHQLRIYLL